MAVITYIAKRRLVSGHVEGSSYALEVLLAQWDWMPKDHKEVVTSTSGIRVERFYREESQYQVTIDRQTDPAIIEQVREFARSVSRGEAFQIDEQGTLAAPVNPIDVVMEANSYQETRVPRTHYFKFSFKVIES
jgi:hypothetical protein